MILDALFGNPSAARCLLYISINHEAYAQEISTRTGTHLNLVQKQLQRLERGNVLVSTPKGRMRFYQLNPRSPYSKDLGSMLHQSIDFFSEEEASQYVARRRPRAPGKPLPPPPRVSPGTSPTPDPTR